MNANRSLENVEGHEWIGLNAVVEQSSDRNKMGLAGWIVNESKNTIELETKKGIKQLPKKEIELKLKLNDGEKKVLVKNFLVKSEERTKYWFRKYFK